VKAPTATDDLIALVCKSLAEEYVGDEITPGLVIAHLREDKDGDGQPARFYVCARRYDADLSYEQKFIARSYNEDLDDAVREVACQVANPDTGHQRELALTLARDAKAAK
jgi:hypothetical protein